jgi:hypothetical protein
MNNFERINFEYDRHSIIDLLPEIINNNSGQFKHSFKCGKKYSKQIENILNLKHIDSIFYFKMTPSAENRIHIDLNLDTNKLREFALILPLTHCDNMIMKWYNEKSDTIVKHTALTSGSSHDGTIPVLSYEKAICVETTVINNPILVKICSWHNVKNISTQNCEELFLSIRFDYSLTESYIKSMTLSH